MKVVGICEVGGGELSLQRSLPAEQEWAGLTVWAFTVEVPNET